MTLDALAYTDGQDVYFGRGQYAPTSRFGMRLLLHELAHVVQQGGVSADGGPVPCPHDLPEREADAAAEAVMSGRRGPVLTPVGAHTIQRQFGEVRRAEAKAELLARLRLDYAKAKKANLRLGGLRGLGWESRIGVVAGGKYKELGELWSRGEYDKFADAVSSVQFDLNLPEREIDGIVGLGTWSRMAGLGEAMAGIGSVSKNLCYEATRARLERGQKLATGRSFELPEDRSRSTFEVILKTIPGRMADVDAMYRGTGAAGALVYAGLGTFVPQEDIFAGGLRPGAAMQVWARHNAFNLLQAGEIGEGKNRRRIRDTDANFFGTSFVFVRYDTETTKRILVRHHDELEWHTRADFDVWIAANTTAPP